MTNQVSQPREHDPFLALPARRTPVKSNVPFWKFSLETLMIIVTLAALFLGLHLVIGPASWAVASFLLLVFAGFASHMANIPVPYWKCVGSAAIFFYLLPPLDYRPGHAETIFNAILFAIGAFLVYSSIRHGHWSTQLLGMVVIIPYILLFALIVQNAINNWPDIVHYWST